MADTYCDKIRFTKDVYNLGYVHIGGDFDTNPMIFAGVLAVELDPDMPRGQLTLISSCPNQIKFVDWLNSTPQLVNPYYYQVPTPPPNPSNLLTGGNTYYIPFNLDVRECGEFECEISYEYVYEVPNTSPAETIVCTGTTKIMAYQATCDFVTCLLEASEVYCNLDESCIEEICDNPCYQRFVRLFLIDQTIDYKVSRFDWKAVDGLYKQALVDICPCDCSGNRNAIGEAESLIYSRNV